MPAGSSPHTARPWLRVRTFERGVEAETQVARARLGGLQLRSLTALSGVRHWRCRLRSDCSYSRRPFTTRRRVLQSCHSQHPHACNVAVVVHPRAICICHTSAQVQTAGGDILCVQFSAGARAGELDESTLQLPASPSLVRVTGSYTEVFQGTVDIAM